tara:strand:+ start:43 stop:459 length:417 start_codon:yes stop_codon:yes gene_type:complete
MSDYKKDSGRVIEDAFGGTAFGQTPGVKSDKYYDKAHAQPAYSMSKTPNYVIINNSGASTNTISFFFGTSQSFADKANIEIGTAGSVSALTGSQYYSPFGTNIAAGTRLDIHPLAWSGSAAASVTFVYQGGIDGQGRG